jgi:prolyl 4-hydroxylase
MEPAVKQLENFLSPEDCAYLIETYDSKVVSSRVVTVNQDGSQTIETHASRTSSTCFLPNGDKVIAPLRTKVGDFLKVNTNTIEAIQFLKYKKGERYVWHHDYLRGAANQRTDTILVYLNDLAETDGGATAFFHHKLKVYPKRGNAIWFKNCDAEGNLLDESLHAGEEILTDATKYALNIWVRQKAL